MSKVEEQFFLQDFQLQLKPGDSPFPRGLTIKQLLKDKEADNFLSKPFLPPPAVIGLAALIHTISTIQELGSGIKKRFFS